MKPIDSRHSVVKSRAAANETTGAPPAGPNERAPTSIERRQRQRGEPELHDDVGQQDGDRLQRRGAQALQDAAFAIDGDDRHQRHHRADGHHHGGQDGQVACQQRRQRRAWRAAADPPQEHEQQDREADRADHAERFAQEDLRLEPGEFPEAAQHGPSSGSEWPVRRRKTSSSVADCDCTPVTCTRCVARHASTSSSRPSPLPCTSSVRGRRLDAGDRSAGRQQGSGPRVVGRDGHRPLRDNAASRVRRVCRCPRRGRCRRWRRDRRGVRLPP